MAEPFKNNFSLSLVGALAHMLAQQLEEFDIPAFSEFVSKDFESLELKQRAQRITDGLCRYMPEDLQRCAEVIHSILHPEDISEFSNTQLDQQGLRGWMVMPVADFVSRRWLKADFFAGMKLLKQLTRRFSAEFAIRDFLLAEPERALSEIIAWTEDSNEHVRRLASEGTRTRLPWGQQLPMFINDPTPLKPILENLMDDDSEYVRRSVANNLNDIAKDHPDYVIDFVEQHKDTSNKNRTRLFKHACRSLFKQGDVRTLALFGYPPFDGQLRLSKCTAKVEWGGQLELEVTLHSSSNDCQNLMLDYVIWHQKANGKLSPKVFKWKNIQGFKGDATYKKSHSYRPVTTRKYYAGPHRIEIQINGKILAQCDFELSSP